MNVLGRRTRLCAHVSTVHSISASSLRKVQAAAMSPFPSPSTRTLHHQLHYAARRAGRVIVRTSADWWEEEDEFDSLTDQMNAKKVFLVAFEAGTTPLATADALRDFLSPLTLHTGFCTESTQAAADRIWEGRNQPPLFLKVRRRAAFDAGDYSAFARELLCQNWRTDLDYGLGKRMPLFEALLVVADAAAISALAGAILGSSLEVKEGAVVVLSTGEGAPPAEGEGFGALAPRVEETMAMGDLQLGGMICSFKQF